MNAMHWAVAVCVVGWGFAAADDNARPESEHLYVVGQGVIEVEPDQVIISLELEQQDPDLAKAKGVIDGQTAEIAALAESLEMPKGDVRFSRLVTYPEYDWDAADQYVFVGHVVSLEVSITLRELEHLNTLVDGLTSAGISGIRDMRMASSQTRALERQATLAAIDDARDKAAAMAGKLNARLGPIYSVSDVPLDGYYEPDLARFSFAPQELGSGLQPGAVEVTRTVYCAFRLTPRE